MMSSCCLRRSVVWLALVAMASGLAGCVPAAKDELPKLAHRATVTLDDATLAAFIDDLDADGYDDLIIADPYGGEYPATSAGNLHVLFGPIGSRDLDADGADLTFRGQDAYRYNGFRLATADLNNDGRLDLISRADVSLEGTGSVYAFDVQERGAFPLEESAYLTLDGPVTLGESLVGKDYNGDGVDDLVLSCPVRSQVYVVLGPREGHVQLPEDADVIFSTGDGALGTVLSGHDLDGDGAVEIAMVEPIARVAYIVPGGLIGPHNVAEVARLTARSTDPADAVTTIRLAAFEGCGKDAPERDGLGVTAVLEANRDDSDTQGTVFFIDGALAGEIDLRADARLILQDVPRAVRGSSLVRGVCGVDAPAFWVYGLPGTSLIPESNLKGAFWLIRDGLAGAFPLGSSAMRDQAYRVPATAPEVTSLGAGVAISRTDPDGRPELLVVAQGAVLFYRFEYPGP